MTTPSVALRWPTRLPLIGRGAELASLRHRLDDLDRASARAILVRGEVGIGKSRLLAELTPVLPHDGWVVLEVRVDEIGRFVPYGEFRRAVASFAGTDDSSLPAELARRLVDALDVASDQPLPAIHAAALRFVAAVTQSSRLAIAVDDLELADDDTLVLLANILRQRGRHPLALIANLRHPEPADRAVLAAFLDRAAADDLLDEVDLGPLDDTAIGDLAAAVLGQHPGDDIVRTAWQNSGGNPFFAVQSLLNTAESRCVGGDTSPVLHSADRSRIFLDRMLRLGPDARHLARAAALLGAVSVPRIPLAAELADLPFDRASVAFDGLVDRGVLQPEADGGFRLSHQLVRAALYDEIGPAERARWHRLAAERLASLPSSTAADLEIAGHVQHVAERGDEYAITVLSRAAETMSVSAPRSAIPWFERALSVTPDEHPRRAQITAHLARALLRAAEPQRAIDVGRGALTGLAGEAHNHLASLLIDSLVLVGAMGEAAVLADAELARGNPGLRLAAASSRAHMVANRLEDSLRDAAVAERLLKTAPVTEQLHALGYLALTRTLQSDAEALAALWQRIAALAKHAPPTAQLAAYAVMSYTQATAGETGAASSSIAYGQQLFARVGWTLYRIDLAVAQAYNAAHLGEWPSALAIIDSIEDELSTSGSFMHRATIRALKIDMLANRGEWTAARKAADRTESENRHGAAVQTWAHAGLDLLVGDLPAARRRLERQLDRSDVPTWLSARLASRLAEVEIEAGNLLRAAELVADLATGRGDLLGHPTRVAVQLAHGCSTGDLSALQAARALADQHRLALLSGRARLLLGQHNIEAEANLTQAARIFQQIGAAPWRRRAVVEIRRRGLKIPRERSGYATTLTEIESEIARLVQLGHSNREIAATVFLSVKTVENYLSRIYQKTGLMNRLGLTRALDTGALQL